MFYWRPGLRVWWRRDGEAQLGLDPPTILVGLTPADHTLLEALAMADPQLDCWTVAMKLGWKREDFLAFARRLPAHALVAEPTKNASPTVRYWSLAQAAGIPSSTARHTSKVIVDGVDFLGLELTDAIACAGLGTIFLHDPGPVLPHDVHPGGFLTDDVGRPRTEAATQRLRPRHPMTAIHPARPVTYSLPPRSQTTQPEARTGERHLFDPVLRSAHPQVLPEVEEEADLAVVIAHGAIPPQRLRPYVETDTPVLPVTVLELDIMVGPLLAPPGPCLRCVYLALTDADPRWPALATQLAAEVNRGIDPVVTNLAASLASHQITAIADRRPAAVVGVSLHVDGMHPIPRYRTWQRHEECGCSLTHLAA